MGPKLFFGKCADRIANHFLVGRQNHGALFKIYLNNFEGHGSAFTAANAQSGQAFFKATRFECMNECDHDARA